jgi:hypothetical protein
MQGSGTTEGVRTHSLCPVPCEHGPNGPGVVVALEETDLLSLEEEDGGVDNLVILRQVEQVRVPAVQGKGRRKKRVGETPGAKEGKKSEERSAIHA